MQAEENGRCRSRSSMSGFLMTSGFRLAIPAANEDRMSRFALPIFSRLRIVPLPSRPTAAALVIEKLGL